MRRFSGRLPRDGNLLCDDGHAELHLGCRVLARGYLADRTELAGTLGLASHTGLTNAELLARAYRRWGPDLQARLSGEYAAVIHDEAAGTTLLTHDALGLAPLFYAETPACLRFSTHLIDLLDTGSGAALDQAYLADFLALGYFSSHRTPYRGIHRLLPGMSLRWASGKATLLQTWDLARIAPLEFDDQQAYEERFRCLLGAGVRGALDTTGASWVALSGGLDSSTVACVAAAEKARGLGAYSLVCPGFPEADEQPWMRAVTQHCDIPWHPVDVEQALPFAELPDGFLAEPTGAVINAARRRLTNALFDAHGVTALLTGDGGDAILGAWPGPIPAHLADPLFRGNLPASLRAVREWAAGSGDTRSRSYWLLRALIAPALDHLRGRQIHTGRPLPLPPWVEADYAHEMRLGVRGRRRLATRCRLPGRQQVWDRLWIGAMSMAAVPATLQHHDVRTPLLHRPLVEFLCAIPWTQKLRPRCDRYLQRRALKGVLPETVRLRAGKAVGTWSLVEGLRRSRDWVAYLCDSPRIAELGIADRERWRTSVLQATVGQTHGDRYFVAGVAIEAWLKGLDAWCAQARSSGSTSFSPNAPASRTLS